MRGRELVEYEARLRQLLASDRNAMDIYRDLAGQAPDRETAAALERLVADEARHMALDADMLRIIVAQGGESAS